MWRHAVSAGVPRDGNRNLSHKGGYQMKPELKSLTRAV